MERAIGDGTDALTSNSLLEFSKKNDGLVESHSRQGPQPGGVQELKRGVSEALEDRAVLILASRSSAYNGRFRKVPLSSCPGEVVYMFKRAFIRKQFSFHEVDIEVKVPEPEESDGLAACMSEMQLLVEWIDEQFRRSPPQEEHLFGEDVLFFISLA